MDSDALACALTSLIAVSVVESIKMCARRGWLDRQLARKCMHICVGPLFLACWPLFSAAGQWYAALVPLAIVAKFAATGLGMPLPGAADEIASMSRTGAKEELLRGPLLYGASFVALTLWRFQRLPAAVALTSLCVGDGLAELVGVRLGRWSGHLPWSPRKSWAGSVAFVCGSFVASCIVAVDFRARGWCADATLSQLAAPLALAALVGAARESLPMRDVDNVLVPGAVALVLAMYNL